ncbi:MAG: CHAT domain-containing protein [Armatimonadetes bacterium]|nr:CHAT domain-containing protein [Armatimonadota bacterium]
MTRGLFGIFLLFFILFGSLPARADTADECLNQGIQAIKENLPDRGRELLEKALKLYPPDNLLGIARSHKYLGNIAFLKQDFLGAKQRYLQALKMLEKGKGEALLEETANVYNNLGKTHDALGDYRQALDFFQKTASLDRSAKNARYGTDLLNLGHVKDRLGDALGALRAYEEAEPLLKGSDTLEEADLAYNVGVLKDRTGDLDQALVKLAEALSLYRKIAPEDAFRQGRALQARANTLRRKGDLPDALTDLLTALELLQKGENKEAPAGAYNDLGLIYEDLNNLPKAAQAYEDSAAAYKSLPEKVRKGNLENLAISLDNLANVKTSQGEATADPQIWAEADTLYRESLALREKMKTPSQLARSYNNLGRVAERKDRNKPDLHGALLMYNLALTVLKGDRTEGGKDFLPTVLCNIANVELKRGDVGQAIARYEKIIPLFTRNNDLPGLMDTYSNLGVAYEKQKRKKEALTSYQSAIAILEDIRKRLHTEKDRSTIVENRMLIYERIIEILFGMGAHDEAFYYVEKSKAKAFLDLLGSKEIIPKNQGSERALSLARKERELQVAVESARDLKELTLSLKEHQKALLDLKSLDPEYVSLKTVSPLQPKEIQALLDTDSAILEYFFGEQISLLFVVTRDQISAHALESRLPSLLKTVHRFRHLAADQTKNIADSSWQDILFELYGGLLAPVADRISGKGHLFIVPHNILHHLPFQALVTEKDKSGALVPQPKFLVEKFNISYLPSASVLKYAREKNTGRNDVALILGNAKYPDGVIQLKGSEKEARQIASILPKSTLRIYDQATETLVKKEGSAYGLLHFATHGQLKGDRPLESRLLLTQDSENDGYLTVQEIFGLNLSSWLVVLSACETGKVSSFLAESGNIFPAGDDLVGLSRAFVYAGTPSVVASLWEVSDASTALLMEKFYQILTGMNPADKAKALREAQLSLIHFKNYASLPDLVEGQLAHPYYWAAFSLIGDFR